MTEMNTKSAAVLGICIIVAAAVVATAPAFLPTQHSESMLRTSGNAGSFAVTSIEFSGAGDDIKSIETNENWGPLQAKLNDRFIIVHGKGPFGHFTQRIPIERIIIITTVEKTE